MEPKNMIDSAYLFGDDMYSRMRLNLQHFLTVKIQGYLLHPSIPIDDPNIAIADIGTGTGIWLLDLAGQLPTSVKLWGGDIRTEQFDAQELLPSNVELQYMDVTKEISSDLEAKFDVVNIRYLAFVLKDSDATTAIRNVVRMLKPGGYIQWLEPDKLANASVIKAKPSNVTTALQLVPQMLHSLDDRSRPTTWMASLDHLLESGGMQNVRVEKWNSVISTTVWRTMLQEDIIAGLLEMQQRIPAGDVKERFAELLVRSVA